MGDAPQNKKMRYAAVVICVEYTFMPKIQESYQYQGDNVQRWPILSLLTMLISIFPYSSIKFE